MSKKSKFDFSCWWQKISLEAWNLIAEFFAIICFYHVFTFLEDMKGKSTLAWFIYISSMIALIFNIFVILGFVAMATMNTFCNIPFMAQFFETTCFFFQDWDMLMYGFCTFQIIYQGLFGSIYFLCAGIYGISLLKEIKTDSANIANEAIGGDVNAAGNAMVALFPTIVLCMFCIGGFIVNSFFTAFTFLKYTYNSVYINAIRCKRIFPVKYFKGKTR